MKPEKAACPVWQISKRGGVGSERKNFLLAGCQNPLSRITEAKEILRMKDMLIGIMAENSGQPFEKVKDDCERDHYLSAAEACEYGLIDKVVTSAAV